METARRGSHGFPPWEPRFQWQPFRRETVRTRESLKSAAAHRSPCQQGKLLSTAYLAYSLPSPPYGFRVRRW